MSVITCLKCDTTVKYEGEPPVACATCGAIYAKVEAAARETGAHATSRPWAPATAARRPFIDELRTGTHYPSFRSVASVLAWLLYLIAALSLIGAIASGSLAASAGALAGAALLVVVARAAKEAATMLADLSDAAVYVAQHQRNGAPDSERLLP